MLIYILDPPNMRDLYDLHVLENRRALSFADYCTNGPTHHCYRVLEMRPSAAPTLALLRVPEWQNSGPINKFEPRRKHTIKTSNKFSPLPN